MIAPREPTALRDWARALRVHHWSKNLLVFLPALLAHRETLVSDLAVSGLAFAAFSLVSSAAYLLNDFADLAHDRRHATKRHRPLASGRLSLRHGIIAMTLLAVGSMMLVRQAAAALGVVLIGYVLLTTLYSLALKRQPVLDVLVLAGLYAMRLMAGSAATGIPLSRWLTAFAIFVFLSLALAKRATEVAALPEATDAVGRGYGRADLEVITALGAASAYTAVLVFALYVDAGETRALYRHAGRLWAIVPLLLYWLSRMWLLVRRGHVHDDPVVFALRDRISWFVAAAALSVGLIAR